MPRLRRLEFPRVAALCFRMTAAAVFRDRGVPGRDTQAADDQRELMAAIDTAARALRSKSVPPLSSAMAAAWLSLEASKPRSGSLSGDVIAERFHTFGELIRQKGKRADDLAGPHSTSTDHESAADDVFMSEITPVLESLTGFVADLHCVHAKFCTPPLILLETAHLHQHQTTDLLDAAAITGTCRLDENQSTSIVGLGFRDDSVDWGSLCQLPYVLMHEVLCHAYQGLVGDGRRPASTGCGWSEGWMDTLALRLTEIWLRGANHDGLPKWLRENKDAVYRECVRLNGRRREPQSSLSPTDLAQRVGVQEASGRLEALFKGAGRRNERAFFRMLAFSLQVNLLALPQSDRNEAIDRLAGALELFHGERLDRVVGACSRFSDSHDWEAFRNELRMLTSPPS